MRNLLRDLTLLTAVTAAGGFALLKALNSAPSRGLSPPTSREARCPQPPGPYGAKAYFEFQVAVPARIPTGFPRYPRAANAAEVLFQVVVDPCGFPDLTTLKILKSDRPELTESTRALLSSLQFLPAELPEGHPVPQIVQEVVEFP